MKKCADKTWESERKTDSNGEKIKDDDRMKLRKNMFLNIDHQMFDLIFCQAGTKTGQTK